MQSVPAPARLTPLGRRAAVAALLAALGTAVAIGAVLLSASSPPRPAVVHHPYTGLIGGVQLQQARCVQWNAGTAAERDKVAGALSYVVGGASTSGGRGTTLSTSETYALFDRACSSTIAAHWLLYELYTRAAAFRSYAAR
jgi:hypothetical protein